MDKTKKILVKERFLSALEDLPDEKVEELLDFTESLLLKEQTRKSSSKLDGDPILKIIGMLDEVPFAEDIDNDLYGPQK